MSEIRIEDLTEGRQIINKFVDSTLFVYDVGKYNSTVTVSMDKNETTAFVQYSLKEIQESFDLAPNTEDQWIQCPVRFEKKSFSDQKLPKVKFRDRTEQEWYFGNLIWYRCFESGRVVFYDDEGDCWTQCQIKESDKHLFE